MLGRWRCMMRAAAAQRSALPRAPLPGTRSTVVLGRPIEVPQVAQPSHELVEQYLHAYITQLTALFERHKAACGCGGMQLRVM